MIFLFPIPWWLFLLGAAGYAVLMILEDVEANRSPYYRAPRGDPLPLPPCYPHGSAYAKFCDEAEPLLKQLAETRK